MGPIKPGDRFFRVVPRHRGDPITGWIVVTKVGRKWAEFLREGLPETSFRNYDRFDMETRRIDGGNFTSPGRVYRSEKEYRDSIRCQALWSDLRKQIDRLILWLGEKPPKPLRLPKLPVVKT